MSQQVLSLKKKVEFDGIYLIVFWQNIKRQSYYMKFSIQTICNQIIFLQIFYNF
jgi:hypothetical protein